MKWKYKYSSHFKIKNKATNYANRYREKGYIAIINKVKNKYIVYIYRRK